MHIRSNTLCWRNIQQSYGKLTPKHKNKPREFSRLFVLYYLREDSILPYIVFRLQSADLLAVGELLAYVVLSYKVDYFVLWKDGILPGDTDCQFTLCLLCHFSHFQQYGASTKYARSYTKYLMCVTPLPSKWQGMR